jgi:hypothetical protein
MGNGISSSTRFTRKSIECFAAPPGVEPEHPDAGAVVHRRVLIDPRGNLEGVHLDPLAGDRAAIPLGGGMVAPRPKRRHPASMQDLPDGRRRQPPLVQAEQLGLDQLGTEAATRPQVEDERLELRVELRGRRPVRSAAAGHQPLYPAGLVAPPPLSQGGTGDTAPAAHLPCVAAAGIQLDPSTPCLRRVIHGAKLHLEVRPRKTRRLK